MGKSKIKLMSHHDIVHLHFQLMSLPISVSASDTLWFLRYSLDEMLKINVTMTRSWVKSRSHHDIPNLHLPTNVRTKYQVYTPYGFRNIAQTRFQRSRSLQQGKRSKPRCYTPKGPNQCLSSVSFLHLMVS